MRSATAPELATLARLEKVVTVRLKVANGSGTMIDLTSWLEAWSIDHDIDQPVGGATFSFSRAHGATQSLSPLREDSTLNVDDAAAFAPLLDLNRIVTFEVATTNIGAVIVVADYKMLFKGTIDVVNFEKSPISIECRDLGAPFVDRWIEAEAFYGTTPVGTAIETVMQDIIDDVFGAAVYTLYVPVSPSFLIVKYSQQKMSVMDALQDLVQLIGWDVRYEWDNGTSAFRLTLLEPDRAKTVPDHTFGPSTYIDISRLSLDLTNIRNVVTISYRDGPSLGNRNSVTVLDTPSINKYGRRFLGIQEPDVSPIDTSTEATTMADAALADLKEPKAEQEVEMPLFWPATLRDLHRYSDNKVHYNVDQDLSVAELRHFGSRNTHRTTVRVRGTPIGQYLTWFGRGGSGGPGSGGQQAFPPQPFILPLNTELDASEWVFRFYAVYGTGGGGANLTYTVKAKNHVGFEATLSSGNASAFPFDLDIPRQYDHDSLVRFTVTDVVTGMIAEELAAVPMREEFLTGTGTLDPTKIGTGALPGGVTDSGGNPLNDAFYISANTADDVADGTTFKKVTGVVASLITPNSSTGRNRCLLTNTTNQSLTTTTNTIITWDSETFDVGGLHSTASNTGRITIPTGGDTGLWLFIALLTFDSNGTGARSVEIRRSDGVPMAVALIPPVASGPTTAIQVVAVDSAPAAGTWYEARGYQSSGGNLNVIAAVSFFAAHHLW